MKHSCYIASDDPALHSHKTRDVASQECSTASSAPADGCIPDARLHSTAGYLTIITLSIIVTCLVVVYWAGQIRDRRGPMHMMVLYVATSVLLL